MNLMEQPVFHVVYVSPKALSRDCEQQIKLGGFLLRSGSNLKRFAAVTVCVHAPDGEEIELPGEVVQVVPGQGLAVQFGAAAALALEKLMEKASGVTDEDDEPAAGDPEFFEPGQEPQGSVPGRCINFAKQGYVAFSYDMVGKNDSLQVPHDYHTDAADLWGNVLDSSVEIGIDANFDPLDCNAHSALLGTGGAQGFFSNFTGAPRANTWYPVALGNAFAGTDLDTNSNDIGVTFNSTIGTTCDFPRKWYYGLDANPPADGIDFVTVRGEFEPGLIEALSKRLGVPRNYMFIGTPGDRNE